MYKNTFISYVKLINLWVKYVLKFVLICIKPSKEFFSSYTINILLLRELDIYIY